MNGRLPNLLVGIIIKVSFISITETLKRYARGASFKNGRLALHREDFLRMQAQDIRSLDDKSEGKL